MKTIQQIMEEERAKSQLNKVSEGRINNLIQLSSMLEQREANGWAEKNKEGIKKRPKDYGKKISITGKEVRSNPLWKQGWMKTIEERDNNPENRKNHLEGIAKRTASKEWKEKNQNARKKVMKCVVSPDGIFPSVKAAIEFYNIKRNSLYSEAWLMRQRKKFPNQYYLISQEEYIILTGNDPF